MLVRFGPHHICLKRQPDQHGAGRGVQLPCHETRGTERNVLADAGGILPGHPLRRALTGLHRPDLHVRPRCLHTQERAAEAHRGCTQGDHDVLAAWDGVKGTLRMSHGQTGCM